MKGSGVISALKKKFGVSSDLVLAARLGNTGQAIRGWKERQTVTERQIAGLVHKASVASAKNLQANAIRPLVEYFRINKKKKSRMGDNYELFSITAEDGTKHPYLNGLQAELKSNHGVYMFFDSRGHAIYAGKAQRQSLWKEMNLAFNRKRGEVQKIKRVRHPSRKQPYQTSDEKARQIYEIEIPLHDLATYFSAYQVADGLINEVEAMLVRSFANDLLNKNMERFGQQKKKKKKTKKPA